MQRAIIKTEYKDRLLGSQALLGSIADDLGVQVQTVTRNLQSDSPVMTEVVAIDAIRKALKLSGTEIVHDYVPVGDKHLQHE